MSELELKVTSPSIFPQEIIWNKEEFANLVKEITQKYDSLVYTDDQIADAKKDRAMLNNLKKRIADRRIEIKKAVMVPYDKFEDEVKEIVKMIDEPAEKIDEQVKDYETKQQDEKKKELEVYFDANVNELKGLLPFKQIFEKRWLNKSYSMKNARADIDEKIVSVRRDIRGLEDAVGEDYFAIAKSTYFQCFDLARTMSEVKRLKEVAEEERKRKQEQADKQERILATQLTNAKEDKEETRNEVKTIDKPEPKSKNDFQTKVFRTSFTVYGTREQILALKLFMEENGIRFGNAGNECQKN